MKNLRVSLVAVWFAICLMPLALQGQTNTSGEHFHVETLLIWGTNDPQSPDPKHKPVDAELAKKLEKGPYRWKYYYEVNRQIVALPAGEEKKGIKLSSHLTLDMKNPKDGRIEVVMHGDGKPVSRHAEPFPMGKHFILSGDAKNETAWFAVIKRVEPPAKPEKPAAK